MSDVTIAIEREVKRRASGCCEYCLLAQEDFPYTFHIEHIIARKHGGETVLENLCLSCPTCNSFKGSDIAGADTETGQATFLFHPRKQNWEDHFRLEGAIIEPLTPEGRLTVFLLQLNHPERISERKMLMLFGAYPCMAVRE